MPKEVSRKHHCNFKHLSHCSQCRYYTAIYDTASQLRITDLFPTAYDLRGYQLCDRSSSGLSEVLAQLQFEAMTYMTNFIHFVSSMLSKLGVWHAQAETTESDRPRPTCSVPVTTSLFQYKAVANA